MTRYFKFIIALLGGLSSWGVTASVDGYEDAELWGILAILATALAVFVVPNTPPPGEPRRPDVSEMAA